MPYKLQSRTTIVCSSSEAARYGVLLYTKCVIH